MTIKITRTDYAIAAITAFTITPARKLWWLMKSEGVAVALGISTVFAVLFLCIMHLILATGVPAGEGDLAAVAMVEKISKVLVFIAGFRFGPVLIKKFIDHIKHLAYARASFRDARETGSGR